MTNRAVPLDNYKRRVLLISTGGSPAVITETVYGLIHQQPPFIPTEIRAITTTVGRDAIARHLFAEKQSQIEQLWTHYKHRFNGGDAPEFTLQEHVYVFKDNETKLPLEDITEAAHCNQAASLFKRVLFDLFDQTDTAVYCSLSGGRKSMSFFLGYLFCLGARDQDQLGQTLLQPLTLEYDKHFFFPHPTEPHKSIHPKTSYVTLIPRNKIDITMVNIPFAPLFHNKPFRDALSNHGTDYNQAMDIAQNSAPRLGFDSKTQSITLQDKPLGLNGRKLCYYLLLIFNTEGVSADDFDPRNAKLVCAIAQAQSNQSSIQVFFNQHIRLQESRRKFFKNQKTKVIALFKAFQLDTRSIRPVRSGRTKKHYIPDIRHAEQMQTQLIQKVSKAFNLPSELSTGQFKGLSQDDICYIEQYLNQEF